MPWLHIAENRSSQRAGLNVEVTPPAALAPQLNQMLEDKLNKIMSNDVMNAHIKYGHPCGEDADFFEIADWAGTLLLDIQHWYETEGPESWSRLDEIMEAQKAVTEKQRKCATCRYWEQIYNRTGSIDSTTGFCNWSSASTVPMWMDLQQALFRPQTIGGAGRKCSAWEDSGE